MLGGSSRCESLPKEVPGSWASNDGDGAAGGGAGGSTRDGVTPDNVIDVSCRNSHTLARAQQARWGVAGRARRVQILMM